jgi:hypothetical protein
MVAENLGSGRRMISIAFVHIEVERSFIRLGENGMLTLLDQARYGDSRRHRAQLYLMTYALLGLTFLATAAAQGASADLFVPLYGLSLLTGLMALVVRTDWLSRDADRTDRSNAVTEREAGRLDRIASIRIDRRGSGPAQSLLTAFPDFETRSAEAQHKEIGRKEARPRDPFAGALSDYTNRGK